jgi:hypothetical protein
MSVLDVELNAIDSFNDQLSHCELVLRRRSVPRVAVLNWLALRIAKSDNSIDFNHFSNVKKKKKKKKRKNFSLLLKWLWNALTNFVLPATTSAFPSQTQYSASVPPEASRLIVAMATAMGRFDTIVAQLTADNERLRVMLWALVSNSPFLRIANTRVAVCCSGDSRAIARRKHCRSADRCLGAVARRSVDGGALQ